MDLPICQGRIVWATLHDDAGNAKKRPAVVLTPNEDIEPNGIILVAAISTQLGRARFSESVALPTDPDGHAVTKLKQPSEVVCTWVPNVPYSTLTPTSGMVPQDVLEEILMKVARLT